MGERNTLWKTRRARRIEKYGGLVRRQLRQRHRLVRQEAPPALLRALVFVGVEQIDFRRTVRGDRILQARERFPSGKDSCAAAVGNLMGEQVRRQVRVERHQEAAGSHHREACGDPFRAVWRQDGHRLAALQSRLEQPLRHACRDSSAWLIASAPAAPMVSTAGLPPKAKSLGKRS